MSIAFGLSLFGWHIGRFDVQIDMDMSETTAPPVDRAVKKITKRWFRHMVS